VHASLMTPCQAMFSARDVSQTTPTRQETMGLPPIARNVVLPLTLVRLLPHNTGITTI
jgi:hypothetical protein